MKKLCVFWIVCLLLVTICVAVNADTLTKTFTSTHFYKMYTGSMVGYISNIGQATHTYQPKVNSANTQYTGATNQGTSLVKKGSATTATINTLPNYSVSITNANKTLKVTYSGGNLKISYKDTIYVAQDGSQTQTSSVATLSTSFSASKTYTK